MLGGLGQLFKNPARLYVYPGMNLQTRKIVTAETFAVKSHLRHLYVHLLENRFVQAIQKYDEKLLPVRTRDVLGKIQSGDAAWESLVPPAIVEVIKATHLFGHAERKEMAAT